LRALARVGAYGGALGERYRIEPVLGRWEGVYGSSVGCWGACLACVVLWELVAWLGVSGGVMVFVWGMGFVVGVMPRGVIFEHPQWVL
jgi:hypothetical protein